MAERLICPNCGRPCYTAAPEAYNPCPNCAFVFNSRGPIPPELIKERRNTAKFCLLCGDYVDTYVVDRLGSREVCCINCGMIVERMISQGVEPDLASPERVN